MTARAEAIDHLKRALLDSRNRDGGWGYYAGKASRLEPTAWGLLAFAGDAATDGAESIVGVLARWQRPDGLMSCVSAAPPNLAFNGLAALALIHAAASRPSMFGARRLLARLVPAIARVEGRRPSLSERVLSWLGPSTKPLRQNDELRGWPWVERTFSWVEPTAWCLLALKRSPGQVPHAPGVDRFDEAERLLLDRCCTGGGWNYGNSNVFGQDLRPYVPTTAIALLAMQNRRDTSEVRHSVEFLLRSCGTEVSGIALSLASIALRTYGLPMEKVDEALVEDALRTGLQGNNAARAMALCALTGGSNDATPFAV